MYMYSCSALRGPGTGTRVYSDCTVPGTQLGSVQRALAVIGRLGPYGQRAAASQPSTPFLSLAPNLFLSSTRAAAGEREAGIWRSCCLCPSTCALPVPASRVSSRASHRRNSPRPSASATFSDICAMSTTLTSRWWAQSKLSGQKPSICVFSLHLPGSSPQWMMPKW